MTEVETHNCESCPRQAAIDIAERTLIQNKEFHKSQEERKTTLGFLALKADILEGLRKTVGCNGPQQDYEGSIVCNLAKSADEIAANLMGPNQNAKMLIDYSPYASTEEPEDSQKKPSNGQYL